VAPRRQQAFLDLALAGHHFRWDPGDGVLPARRSAFLFWMRFFDAAVRGRRVHGLLF
jgi:hypothetical protein